MDSHAGENLAKTISAANTIIHNEKVYFVHPIYNNYGCSKDGYVINLKKLIPRKGTPNESGYLNNFVSSNDGKRNKCLSHRSC